MENKKDINVLIVGVGGQGTLLASRILGSLAEVLGLDCKLSEVHGMAQRGGSVVTHARLADKVFSPIITEGAADVVLSFEQLEAFRARHFLGQGGTLIVNTQQILPMPVITGAREYPENIIDTMKAEGINVVAVNALDLAKKVGNIKTVNTIMLGVTAKKMGVSYDDIEKALKMTVSPKLVEMNITALKLGYNYAE